MEAFNKSSICVFILLGVCVALICLLFNVAKNDDSLQNETDITQNDTCLLKDCLVFAGEYLKNIDFEVKPCDDFYKFVCNNYAQENPRPLDKNNVSPTSRIEDVLEFKMMEMLFKPINESDPGYQNSLKQYFRSCYDTKTLEKNELDDVQDIIKSLGGWPVVEDLEPGLTWQEVMYRIYDIGLLGNYIFDLDVIVDFNDATKYILTVSPPEFQLKRQYLVEGRGGKLVKAYHEVMVNVAKLFGATEENAIREASDAINFLITIANASKSWEQLKQDWSSLYNIYTIADLEKNFTDVPWYDYINKASTEHVEVPRTTKAIVSEPSYIKTVLSLLNDTDNRIVRNLLIFNVLWDLKPYMSKKMENLWWKFNQGAVATNEQQPRSTRCLKLTTEGLEVTTSAIYIKEYFDRRSKKIAKTLVKYIRDEFKEVLNNTKWSKEDKRNALEKIDALHEVVGYPDEFLNEKLIRDYYTHIQIGSGDFLRSVLNVTKFQRILKYKNLRKKVDRTDWTKYAKLTDVNAFYTHDLNVLFFPAGTLQGLYFNKNVPNYINFGAIGTTIGHEISHGFDDSGQEFDKYGALHAWWSNVALKDFAEKKRCLVRQFNRYSYDDVRISGQRTLGENLADLNGWKSAYLGYQAWAKNHPKEPSLPGMNFTHNQIFWIAGATTWCSNEEREIVKYTVENDVHAPNEFRVNGPLSNLKMFAEDFQCPLGSKMNPLHKCSAW